MTNNRQKIWTFLYFFMVGTSFLTCVYGQKEEGPTRESFEHKVVLPSYKTAGKSQLSISKKHHYFGKSSLQWNWSGNAAFETSDFQLVSKKDSPLAYGDHFPASPTFVMSVYNEKKQEDTIKIIFLGKDKKERIWFPLPLNFTGWRTIWVPFFEMQRDAPKKGQPVHFETIKIVSDNVNSSGKLYFDDIVFSQYQDDRHPYPDRIVPFIKSDMPPEQVNHWMPLMKNMDRLDSLKIVPVGEKEKRDLNRIERRVDATFDQSKKGTISYAKANKEFQKLSIQKNDGVISGPPLTYRNSQVYFKSDSNLKKEAVDIKVFGKEMKKLAQYYQRASKEDQPKIAKLFITASRYYLDEGWQAGSSGGTRHHIGYGVRELTDAFYMMKNPLKKAGILDEVGGSLKWLFNFGQLVAPEGEFQANIDYYNTQSFYYLMLIFLTEDKQEQAALMSAYSNYMSITLAQNDEKGVFKKDGTVWHHHGHYPAYGIGAFRSVPPVINILSNSSFEISTAGQRNFKKALLATRLYSQLYDWGFGNAGRHPLEDNSIKSLRKAYLLMTYAGNPEHTTEIDRDFAAAYLRLWGNKDPKNAKILKNAYHVKAETLPGYTVFPYAATAVHRRDHWAAILKGYSKYVWSSEIYVDENRYGRYPANGSIQLLNKRGVAGSGFNQNGWNWNRYPGTTVIVLPFKELEIEDPLLMFKSKESFAGAVKLGGNGVFAMKLNESKGSNADGPMQKTGFPGKLKAHKSVFSFGDKLIAIGTGISSVDEEHPVQTNLFQNYLLQKEMPITIPGKGKVSKFPFKASFKKNSKDGEWFLDAYKNAYHILSDTPVEIRKQKQDSYDNRYSVRTGKMNPKGHGAKETHGNYAVAWLDHGKAPKDASYQYVIYPNQAGNFPESVADDQDYEILMADDAVHKVYDGSTNTMGYAIFDSGTKFKDQWLKSISDPAIMMIQNEEGHGITISVVNPDLNMPDFKDKTKSGLSLPVELTFTLMGSWKAKKGAEAIKSIASEEGTTTITIEDQSGASKILQLEKANK